jgi:hypothetical protein
MRSVAVGVLGTLLWLLPASADAQVYKEIKGCTGSVKRVIACIVIERGVEKVLNVGLDNLVAYIFGKTGGIVPAKDELSPAEAKAVRASLVPWAEFKAFLLSALGKDPAEDPAQLRRKIGDACAAKYSPICAHLGFADLNRYRDLDLGRNCVGRMKKACEDLYACTWTGSTCRANRGTRDLFRR